MFGFRFLEMFGLINGCIIFGLLFRDTSTMVPAYKAGTHSIVYVTVPTEEIGKKISKGIISEKLAACVNIIPKVISIYNWEGAMNEDSEALMIIKTRTSVISKLTNYIKSVHPSKVCEVISTPIQNGNTDYLYWISSEVPKPST